MTSFKKNKNILEIIELSLYVQNLIKQATTNPDICGPKSIYYDLPDIMNILVKIEGLAHGVIDDK